MRRERVDVLSRCDLKSSDMSLSVGRAAAAVETAEDSGNKDSSDAVDESVSRASRGAGTGLAREVGRVSHHVVEDGIAVVVVQISSDFRPPTGGSQLQQIFLLFLYPLATGASLAALRRVLSRLGMLQLAPPTMKGFALLSRGRPRFTKGRRSRLAPHVPHLLPLILLILWILLLIDSCLPPIRVHGRQESGV
eukprot:scaffold33078_cov48-Attheya_sp.AAC.5